MRAIVGFIFTAQSEINQVDLFIIIEIEINHHIFWFEIFMYVTC